jgi:hypothetical protein
MPSPRVFPWVLATILARRFARVAVRHACVFAYGVAVRSVLVALLTPYRATPPTGRAVSAVFHRVAFRSVLRGPFRSRLSYPHRSGSERRFSKNTLTQQFGALNHRTPLNGV